ncbi:Ion transport protein [Maritimibacter sp. 55A14]|uniref:potassium channel family protein n=1 Tax=Maritimibacter sp. 55A14 TaxID=2174844 RepID=UPI000D606CCF|nr:potassium channel family protein [Maritimibacter sp. 55A14]PWE33835.1 Ion transport protein [Maritimibacter sp. 55A14]
MTKSRTFRRSLHDALRKDSTGDPVSRIVDAALVALITVNVIAVILESMPALAAQHRALFLAIERVSILIFTLEYLARLWSCVEDEARFARPWPRLRYMLTPLALIDLLAILPFWLGAFFAVDLRVLRVVRLLRILKLTRYSSALTMLLEVIREEANSFLAGFFILAIILILAASGAYLAEHQVQPEKFGSIPAAMWWAMVTLTTVGYGDVTPITPAGRVFGGLVAVVGIGIAALPAGILASGLADRLRRSREELAEQFRTALQDGVIDTEDERELEELRQKLGLNARIAHEIRRDVLRHRQWLEASRCPHCGKPLRKPPG